MSTGTTIKSLQDIMRKDAGVDGDAQRLGQLVWMLFLKAFDDQEAEQERRNPEYQSPLPQRLRWRTWAKGPEGLTGEPLLDFVNQELFKALKALPAKGKHAAAAAVVRGVFQDAHNAMKSGALMRQVIDKLNGLDFTRASGQHELGDFYERLLADLQNAGNAGEYYTPRAVTRFIVGQVDPRVGETVLDPACGTGGFLISALEHVRERHVKSARDEATLQASLVGVEKKPLPHQLCVTNLLVHGVEAPTNLRHGNTLSRSPTDLCARDQVDVILTNPPFGGIEEDGLEAHFPPELRSRETADLFLVLILALLKEGGRAAVVLPDGFLFGEGAKARIKERLLRECNLHTIVRLPRGVFNPYTGIKTNLLFFTKGEPTRELWIYEHPAPAGVRSYSKTRPLRLEEFEPERRWWSHRQETEHAWKVRIEDIQARGYNLDLKNPRARDEGPGDVEALVREYREAVDEAVKARAAVKEELREALEGSRR